MDKFFNGLDEFGNVIPSAELLAIRPYRVIWDRDRTKNKKKALQELTYVWGMCCRDKNINDYYLTEDVVERNDKLMNDIWGKHIELDELIENAVTHYMLRYPISYYEKEAKRMKEQLDKEMLFIEQFDANERTESGSLVFKPKERNDTRLGIIELYKKIKEIDMLALEEIEQRSKIIGGREENEYEDPNNVAWLDGNDTV